jgi:hypothetical protein
MSMNDASGRSAGGTQEYRAMAATKVHAQPDARSKALGEVQAGTVVLALDTRMDRKGRSFIRHAGSGVPGWSPTHTVDGTPVIVPIATDNKARASVTGSSPRPAEVAAVAAKDNGAAFAVGATMVAKMEAPYFRMHERDNLVQGTLKVGERVEVLENRVDHAGRTKLRHEKGWTPAFSPNGAAVLAPIEVAPIEEAEPPPVPAPVQPAVAPAPAPEPAQPKPVAAPGAVERERPVRSQSMAVGAMDAAQDDLPAYVPRGRRGRLSGRLQPHSTHQQQSSQQQPPQQSSQQWQKVRQSVVGQPPPGLQKVRLLYVSRESGFGMQYGVNDQAKPTVNGFLGDAAQQAGVVVGSVIVSVDGLEITAIQQLAQVLQQKEHVARQFADAAVEFGLVLPAAARSDDLLSLIGSAPQVNSSLSEILESNLSDVSEPGTGHPRAMEMNQLAEQISAVSETAGQLMRDLPGLRVALATATADAAKEELREEISDNESALKQQEINLAQLLNKQLKLVASHSEELAKQRSFQVEEAKKSVAFQSNHLLEREGGIKAKQDAITKGVSDVEEKVKQQDEKKAALIAEHSESTAPIKVEMEVHLKEVAGLDKEIAALIATLKAKQKLRDETMDKADELNASITAQLKLFAAPALEAIDQEKQNLARTKADLQKQADAAAGEVSVAGEQRSAALATRTQREVKIAEVTKELRRVHEIGGRCASQLERLRSDRNARGKIVATKSKAEKEALASATSKLETLRSSDAGEAARSLQSLDQLIPQIESDIAALKVRLDQLAVDKAAFAKAKQFKEAGQAKKDTAAAEEQLKQKEELLSKHKATLASGTAQEDAKAYSIQLLAAEKTAAEAKAAYGAALIAGELEWLGVLKGRKTGADKSEDLSLAGYISSQITLAESEAKSVAQTYGIDVATVSAESAAEVAEDVSAAEAQQAAYGKVVDLILEAFPCSPLAATADVDDKSEPAAATAASSGGESSGSGSE